MACDPDNEPLLRAVVRTMTLLPPRKGLCQLCGVGHAPEEPHNRDALYYCTRFQMDHGRAPRWADAVAHCDENTIAHWRLHLGDAGAWTAADDEALAAAIVERPRYE